MPIKPLNWRRTNKMYHFFFYVAVLFPFLLVSQNTATTKVSDPLVGQWRYLSSTGGFTGKGVGWDASKKITIQFTKTGCFKKTEKGKKEQKDKYKLVAGTSIRNAEE